jgi:ABC-2 type transport system permease protein
VFFVFLFISSMNIPRNLIEATWFRWLATINPVSYLIEAVRSLVIIGWDAEALALGFAVAGGLSVVGFALAARALLNRLERS